MIGCLMKSYNNTLKRGCRIDLRAKVNDSLITGLRVVDCILPVGRGQRQFHSKTEKEFIHDWELY